VEEVLGKITGQPCQVRMEVAGTDDPEPPPANGGAGPSPRPTLEAVDSPLLKRAADVLGAQVVRMEKDFGVGPNPANEE
jgi:hypothetical protein